MEETNISADKLVSALVCWREQDRRHLAHQVAHAYGSIHGKDELVCALAELVGSGTGTGQLPTTSAPRRTGALLKTEVPWSLGHTRAYNNDPTHKHTGESVSRLVSYVQQRATFFLM